MNSIKVTVSALVILMISLITFFALNKIFQVEEISTINEKTISLGNDENKNIEQRILLENKIDNSIRTADSLINSNAYDSAILRRLHELSTTIDISPLQKETLLRKIIIIEKLKNASNVSLLELKASEQYELAINNAVTSANIAIQKKKYEQEIYNELKRLYDIEGLSFEQNTILEKKIAGMNSLKKTSSERTTVNQTETSDKNKPAKKKIDEYLKNIEENLRTDGYVTTITKLDDLINEESLVYRTKELQDQREDISQRFKNYVGNLVNDYTSNQPWKNDSTKNLKALINDSGCDNSFLELIKNHENDAVKYNNALSFSNQGVLDSIPNFMTPYYQKLSSKLKTNTK